MRKLNWAKGERKKCIMMNRDKKVGKRCLRIFLKEIFIFHRVKGKNVFVLRIFQYTFQAIKFLNITKDDDFTSKPI